MSDTRNGNPRNARILPIATCVVYNAIELAKKQGLI